MSLKTGEVMWTLHYDKKCHAVKYIDCRVQTNTKSNKRQPKAVVQGFAKSVVIENSRAVIL